MVEPPNPPEKSSPELQAASNLPHRTARLETERYIGLIFYSSSTDMSNKIIKSYTRNYGVYIFPSTKQIQIN